MTGILKSKKNFITDFLFYVIIAFVFIMPIVRLFLMSLKVGDTYGIGNYIELLKEVRTIESIKNTIIISVFSTILALIMGVLFAFLVAYTNVKRKGLIEILVLLPYIIPSYIITLSWSNLLEANGSLNNIIKSFGINAINIYSLEGIILVLGICNVPVVFLITVNMLRKIPRDLEWASRSCGYGRFETLYKINLPQVMPAIISGGILAFLAAIDNFSVPAFLGISSGIPVLSTYIYEKAISFGPSAFSIAATLAIILSVIALTGTVLQGKLIKKSSNLDTIKEDRSVRIEFTKTNRKIIELGALIFLIVINIVPLIVMISSSFQSAYGAGLNLKNLSLKNYIFLLKNKGVKHAFFNSITLAVIAVAVCIIIGTVIAYIKVRNNSKVMKVGEFSATLTYAIPGIVLALAMIFHWVEPIPGFRPGVYGTIKILIISYITRYLILQVKGSTTAILAVDPALEEAGRVSGASKFRLWKKIMIPLLSKQVLSSAFLIFMAALTELTLSSMLAAAGTKTIGLTIFNYQQAGSYNLSAAMSAIIVFMILIGFIISKFINLKSLKIK
ncbi:MAG: iron ABC transporter permease [Clostridium butyricum]|nr:iron ABC transporter permease [Clostridium butyricum]